MLPDKCIQAVDKAKTAIRCWLPDGAAPLYLHFTVTTYRKKPVQTDGLFYQIDARCSLWRKYPARQFLRAKLLRNESAHRQTTDKTKSPVSTGPLSFYFDARSSPLPSSHGEHPHTTTGATAFHFLSSAWGQVGTTALVPPRFVAGNESFLH